MSGRDVDFLAQCVASTIGNPVLEHIRNRSGEVVLSVYRLVKVALVHAIDNDAVRDCAAQTADILSAFGAEVGVSSTLTFVDDSTFVCGQLLRASRAVYESSAELGELLAGVGVSECAFDANITAPDLIAFARAFVDATRNPTDKGQLTAVKLANVLLRKVDPQLVKRERDDELPPAERVLRLYASALVVMRAFYGEIAKKRTILPHRVKRLAQRLVVIAATEDPALLGMTAMAKSHRDDAGRALQTAILAVVVGRKVTTDHVALAQLAMAALLADVGRVRVVAGGDPTVKLTDAQESHVPAAAAFACIVTGGINPTSAQRTVAVTETSWLERRNVLPKSPYSVSMTPLLMTHLLCTVRGLLEYLAPRDGSPAMPPTDALAAVASGPFDRTCVRLLVSAVGLLPAGAVVELESGEWAVVAGPSRHGPHACMVRLVTDRRGTALEGVVSVDLGDADAPRVARFVEPKRARFNVTRAFVG